MPRFLKTVKIKQNEAIIQIFYTVRFSERVKNYQKYRK